MRKRSFLSKPTLLSYFGSFFLWYFVFAIIGSTIYGGLHPGSDKVPEPISSLIIKISGAISLIIAVLRAIINRRTHIKPIEFTRKNHYELDTEQFNIDLMDGHEFEYWCASLLRQIDFENVEVTQGSGDHGVDILAEKEGIRYAIQCKCYSKNLDNTPVQEVNSGKMMPQYHCQIGAVMTNRYFTKGAKELAEATGTLLWDRDWIAGKIDQLNEEVDPSLNIQKTPAAPKSPDIGKPTILLDNPPISENLSQFIHKAQWHAATHDDEE